MGCNTQLTTSILFFHLNFSVSGGPPVAAYRFLSITWWNIFDWIVFFFSVKNADLVTPKCFVNLCWFCQIVHLGKNKKIPPQISKCFVWHFERKHFHFPHWDIEVWYKRAYFGTKRCRLTRSKVTSDFEGPDTISFHFI